MLKNRSCLSPFLVTSNYRVYQAIIEINGNQKTSPWSVFWIPPKKASNFLHKRSERNRDAVKITPQRLLRWCWKMFQLQSYHLDVLGYQGWARDKRTSHSGGIAFALRCRKHLDDLHRDSTGISRTGWSDGTGTSAPSVALWPAAGYKLELWLTNLFKWLKMNWVKNWGCNMLHALNMEL